MRTRMNPVPMEMTNLATCFTAHLAIVVLAHLAKWDFLAAATFHDDPIDQPSPRVVLDRAGCGLVDDLHREHVVLEEPRYGHLNPVHALVREHRLLLHGQHVVEPPSL